MNDEQDLIALYRVSATEEPDASLDAAILRAAQRRRLAPMAGLFFASAACLAIALTFATTYTPLDRPKVVSEMPGLDQGRERFIARDLSPATDSPGLTVRPFASHDGAKQ